MRTEREVLRILSRRQLAPRKYEPHVAKNFGKSGGLGRGSPGFWSKIKPDGCLAPGGCWIWIGYLDKDGAGKFCTKIGGVVRTLRPHRFLWEQVRGPLPDGMHLFADCGRSDCVNPDHRRLIQAGLSRREVLEQKRPCEHADNRGELSGRAQLRNEDVLFIRSQSREYGLVPVLARIFGMKQQLIRFVLWRRTWKHLGNGNVGNAMTLAELRATADRRERNEQLDVDDFAAARPGAA